MPFKRTHDAGLQAMAEMAEGPIIAVDVKATPQRLVKGPEGSRVRDDRPPRPPSLGEALTRLLQLGSQNTTEAARRHADLVITPRAEGVGLFEFDQLDTAREAGRAVAREALERAPASLLARPARPLRRTPAEAERSCLYRAGVISWLSTAEGGHRGHSGVEILPGRLRGRCPWPDTGWHGCPTSRS